MYQIKTNTLFLPVFFSNRLWRRFQPMSKWRHLFSFWKPDDCMRMFGWIHGNDMWNRTTSRYKTDSLLGMFWSKPLHTFLDYKIKPLYIGVFVYLVPQWWWWSLSSAYSSSNPHLCLKIQLQLNYVYWWCIKLKTNTLFLPVFFSNRLWGRYQPMSKWRHMFSVWKPDDYLRMCGWILRNVLWNAECRTTTRYINRCAWHVLVQTFTHGLMIMWNLYIGPVVDISPQWWWLSLLLGLLMSGSNPHNCLQILLQLNCVHTGYVSN